ncbi:MAG: hypothetical protein ACYC11_12940 [Bellilinea sp.]
MNRKNALAGLWLIGLGILFLVDFFWPGILILIGLSMIISAYMKDEPGSLPPSKTAAPVAPAVPEEPLTVEVEEKVVGAAVEAPLPAVLAGEGERLYLTSRLPEKCPACDAPMKANAEKMARDGDGTVECLFCGYRLTV